MASRYPTTKVFDFCFNPIHIVDDDKDVVVPCGKCSGCLLHKANQWSMRLADEIQYTPYPVFTTLTYNNKYLPKLRQDFYQSDSLIPTFRWISDHDDNIRATLKWKKEGSLSVIDKKREDGIIIDHPYPSVMVEKFNDYPSINYASKRDLQLYNKLLRKLIYERFPQKPDSAKRFRYFAISEQGPTTYRGHIHAIYLFYDKEVSEYFIEYLVFTCWPMCDKDRITNYSHYCEGGASNYLTQYVNSLSCLPKVYTENKDIRPWRLASKACAIGYNNFRKDEVSECYLAGIDTFVKPVASLGRKYIFRFPTGYLSSVFPKCREFRKFNSWRLRSIYGLVYDLSQDYSECAGCRECRFASKFDCAVVRLRQVLCPQDFYASMKCYKYCMEFGCTPEHYLYVLDLVYYKKDMYALKLFYEYQQILADRHESLSIARLYTNFLDLKNKILNGDDYDIFVVRCFLDSLNLDAADFDLYDNYMLAAPTLDVESYRLEVDDILNDMVKTSKFNEMVGQAPTSIY